MTDLETRIVQAIDRLDVPEVNLAESVLAELPAVPGRGTRRRPLLPIAIAALVIALAVLVITPAREAVADWLGIGATEIELIDEQPLPEETSTGSLGDPVSTTAQAADSAVMSPIPSLGQPAGVFDDAYRGRSYVWAATGTLPAIPDSELGAVLSVRPADRVLSTKQILGDVQFGPVELANLPDGTPAFWISGEHVLMQEGSSRPVAANQVLLWVVDDVEFRLESALDLPRVAELAAEVEEGTELLAPG